MTPTTSSSRSRPPGPPRRRLHTLRLLADDPLTFYERLHRDYGDIVFYEVPTGKNCVVFSADLIKEVLEEKLSSPGTPRSASASSRKPTKSWVPVR